MKDFIFKHRRILVIGSIVVIILIIAISIYYKVVEGVKTATLNILIAPSIAEVRIDDKKYSSNSEHKMKPGEYEAEISAEGFVSQSVNLTLLNDETTYLRLFLIPTEENSDWYDTHSEDAFMMSEIASDEAINQIYELRDKYSILNYVPYVGYNYAVQYEEDCDSVPICLEIDADFGFRDIAVEYLQETGQSLTQYIVKGLKYDLPFNRVSLDVPGGLGYEVGADQQDLDVSEVEVVSNVAQGFAEDTFVLDRNTYGVMVWQIKKYGDQYYGVTVRVFELGDDTVGDTYRMVVYAGENEIRPITNLEILLSEHNNPLVPKGLLEAVNEF